MSDDVIDYRFEVEDPTYYTEAWTGQMPSAPLEGARLRIRLPRRQLRPSGILRGMNEGRDTAVEKEGE